MICARITARGAVAGPVFFVDGEFDASQARALPPRQCAPTQPSGGHVRRPCCVVMAGGPLARWLRHRRCQPRRWPRDLRRLNPLRDLELPLMAPGDVARPPPMLQCVLLPHCANAMWRGRSRDRRAAYCIRTWTCVYSSTTTTHPAPSGAAAGSIAGHRAELCNSPIGVASQRHRQPGLRPCAASSGARGSRAANRTTRVARSTTANGVFI